MTKENEDTFYTDAKPVLIWSSVITVVALAFSLIGQYTQADERYPYGSTWQVKCEQSADGRDAQCWLVEVPNQPISGIDIPFSKGSNEKD